MAARQPGSVVPAVDRAIDLLQAIAHAGKPLTLSELSTLTATSRSTAFNTLATLQAHGFVAKNPRFKTYRLGLALFELGNAYLAQVSLTPAFLECASELVAQCGESVKLAMRDGREVVYLATQEGPNSVYTVAQPGARLPAHATAVGKLLLAQLSEAELAVLYQGYDFPARTPQTVRTLTALQEAVKSAQQQAVAYDYEESAVGVNCVAAPVADHTGQVVAAMSIGVPSVRFSPERMAELTQLVRHSAQQLSQMLGWVTGRSPAS
jgi:IclR family transcriptional regulator, KDG regulon repressor